MRFTILGAGAVGGVIGAYLARAGHTVTLVARGAHADALERDGLRVREPAGDWHVRLPVLRRAAPTADEVVLLCVKSPDTRGALAQLPPGCRVVCAQNGVENEALVAAEHTAYGMLVWLPAVHLEPGVVALHSDGCPGVLDLGAINEDDGADIAAALVSAGFDAKVQADIMAWKRSKLASNAPGAIIAAGLPIEEALIAGAIDEGYAVFADQPTISLDALLDRCEAVGQAPIDGADRPGGSLWQSIKRGAVLEIDALNGYIVRRGRALGIPTPVNEKLLKAVHQAAR